MIKKVTAALSERVDRWTDIGLRRMSLLTAVIAVLTTFLILCGCEEGCACHCRDTLSDGLAPVKVNLQWDDRFQETPTGITILAYASNGSLYNAFRSNKTDYAELFLPQGEYTLVAFNQSLNELLPIWFYGFDKFENGRITLSELETPPSFLTGNGNSDNDENQRNDDGDDDSDNDSDNVSDGDELDHLNGEPSQKESKTSKTNIENASSIAETVTEPFVQPSPWFALSEPIKVRVEEEELMNLNYRCKCKVCCCCPMHEAASVIHILTMKLIPQTYTLTVNLNIHNLPALASVKAYVSSLQRTIDLRGEQLHQTASTLLEQWQKRMTSETDGVISSKTTCLTMAVTQESALVLELLLTDGKTKLVKALPLSGNVKVDPGKMSITADLELAEPLPKVEGQSAGAFWVTVSDWGDPTDIDI